MSKRNQHPSGPSNMKANSHIAVLDNSTPKLAKVVGFLGFKGWRYHPTRGFKKESGYIPVQPNLPSSQAVEPLLSGDEGC